MPNKPTTTNTACFLVLSPILLFKKCFLNDFRYAFQAPMPAFGSTALRLLQELLLMRMPLEEALRRGLRRRELRRSCLKASESCFKTSSTATLEVVAAPTRPAAAEHQLRV